MFSRISKELIAFIKHILILVFFLALTFVFLEYFKAYQRGDSFDIDKVIIELPLDTKDDHLGQNFFDEAKKYIEESSSNHSSEEAEYKIYEEELPQNIIVEENHQEQTSDNSQNEVTNETPQEEETEAKPKSIFEDGPVIAIVIDDMGVSKARTKSINSLHYPLTSSYLTYAKDLDEQISQSKIAGHEVIAHIPMEAKNNINNTAPDALLTSMSNKKIAYSFEEMLKKFEGIKGINNHMGSKFTENEEKLSEIIKSLKAHNLFFLDSITSNNSKGKIVTEKFSVKYVNRNIFLDNKNDYNYIIKQLDATEKLATKKGYAIAIGHPKSQTYLALKDWLPEAKKRGIRLIHISEIVEELNK